MKRFLSHSFLLQIAVSLLLVLLLFMNKSQGSPIRFAKYSFSVTTKVDALPPAIPPSSTQPQPFIPLLAPSPLIPFTNNSVPKLSGHCSLNFSAAQDIMTTTATDCWTSFAPYLANVVCCPQFDAMLVTLIGQSSKYSGVLALNTTHAHHCLSDVQKVLASQGANRDLKKICSVHPTNLTEASCPVVFVDEFESIVDTSRLLTACRKIDPVNECCDQVCQNAIHYAARKIALNDLSNSDGNHSLPWPTTRINDCKNIVLRWLANKLDPSTANSVFRGLSNCNLNRVCPLVLPNVTSVVKECGNLINNQTACCKAIKSYVSYLQEQSFVTNLQALKCATSLGKKLQQANVSKNVYNLCRISLKDFSLQESGCLLPSLPSNAVFDGTSGIGFICDLNDNIVAPWPTTSYSLPSSCNRTTKLPSLPTATSSQNGLFINTLVLPLLFTSILLPKRLL
ncbi:Putative GPI-anchored protein [Glycine soja]|nr:Putative GPI-anchored protein [Glycine soja]